MAAANSEESFSSSSSSSSSRCRYQVFLSFRGADTRLTFTSHLYEALGQAGIHTFRDDDEIPRGENIELELQKAIRQSKIAIVVFSEDYASSRWCLDELVMIMKQKETAGWKVIPVFYHVDPSDVRKQTGSFARLFVKHEKRPLEQVNEWRHALKGVADSAGMVLGKQHEAEFVKSIVKNVSKELNPAKFHVPYFIGRDLLMDNINSWLQRGSNDTEIAVLYGIGGVGKTTIVKSIYNQNLDTFESISFLGSIGQRSTQSGTDGLLSLQTQLLHDVLNNNTSQIHDVDEGIMKIKDAICCRTLLLILDDVDTKDQFNAIIGMREWLYPGSKIIVTTRNKGLFAIHEEVVQLKIEPLHEKDSIVLFSWHAFGQPHPVEEFVELSKNVVRHCNGLPLALAAIGSSLSSTRTKEIWESKLQEMEKIPDSKVQKVLRKSYESLYDVYQKDIFLDVACFLIGMDEDYVVQILNGLGLNIGAKWRIDNLINRCLVEKDKHNRLWMHQIIRDMGREIAREQSPNCQRIWDNEEAFTILKEITETEMPFPRLKILDLSHSCCLIRTPYFSLAPKLESLILEGCINLVEIHQSIGELHGLLTLNLRGCKSLKELPEEISQLDSLETINLDGCLNLDGLNIKLEQQLQRRWSLHRDGIVSIMPHMTAMPLKLLFQFWFSRRKKNLRFSTFSLPRFLVTLNLCGTPIRCLSESIKDLTTLKWLHLMRCTMLQKVPGLPTSVNFLALDGCCSLKEVADIMFCNWTLFMGCELLELQERVKQDFIQRVPIRMFVIIGFIMGQIQNVPLVLEIMVASNVLYVLLQEHEGNVASSFEDKAWMPFSVFPGVAFKSYFINQGHSKFRRLILYARLSMTPPMRDHQLLFVRITNNTKGQSKHFWLMFPSTWAFHRYKLGQTFDALLTTCWVGDDDLVFEDGDDVNVKMCSTDPAIQIQMVATELLYVIENDFTELVKAQIASSIFSCFNCGVRGITQSDLFYNFLRKDRNE